MAFNKETKKEFVNEFDSFSEKKQPSFEVGKKENFLTQYTSAAGSDTRGADFLKKEAMKPDNVKALETEKPERNGKKQIQAASVKKRPAGTERSEKRRKEIVSSYTDSGGGASFRTERLENGSFRGETVRLNKFKERTDKQGFKNKAAHFMDVGGRTVEAFKPEENEAAASNVDDKAILATVILNEKFKDEKQRFSEINAEKKNEIKHLQGIIRKEQQTILTDGKFLGTQTEFVDKGRGFLDKYRGAFRDKKFNAFSGITDTGGGNRLYQHDTVTAVAVQHKISDEPSGFSNQESFDKKNELSVRRDEAKAPHGENQTQLADKFSETTVKADDNKGKKSVSSYFSNESSESGERSTVRMSDREKLDLKKSEQKSVKKAENKAVRKAAATAAVANMLRAKKEIQNAVGDMNPTGDLMKDGSAGMLRAAISGIKSAIVNKIRGIMIKAFSAIMAGLLHIVTMAAPLIIVIVIVITIMTSFLSIFTDSSNIPAGDGYVYSYLSETEIDGIIENLYSTVPDSMDYTRESLLRYSLSKVGCEYNQAYHWNLIADIFDCSSLAYRAYRDAGIDISNGGIYSAAEICREAAESGYVAYGDLKPGDLIFYGGSDNGRYMGVYHVAIYVGDGKMVEARGVSSGVVYCDVRTSNVVGYSRYI